jgi:hypothetical protein
MESCAVCNFEWDAIESREITPRMVMACAGLGRLLVEAPGRAAERPEPSRWSALEYAGHVRDVLFNVRDRIVLGAAEDNPVPNGMHGTARIELGLYRCDTPQTLATELDVAALLFTQTFDALPPGFDERPIFYGWPTPATRTLRWVAAQALHECEHHLADVEENIRILTGDL